MTNFFSETLWKKKGIFWDLVKVLYTSLRGFVVDTCSLHASALTYYTLLAIVPMLALAFGIAKGFGLDNVIETQIKEQFQQYELIVDKSISFARKLLDNAKGGVIAGAGVLLLVYTIVKLLRYIEESFNHIWLVKQGRSWQRKVTEYISIAWIAPFFLIVSNAASVFILTQMIKYSEALPVIGGFAHWLFPLLKLVPYLFTVLLLTFTYKFMPNCHVKASAAFFGGLITAIIFHLFQYIYIKFQIGISHYGAIYGSFAAFPLFLIWLQLSWMIVLYGAEVTYAIQNIGRHGLKYGKISPSTYFTKLASIATLRLLSARFEAGLGSTDIETAAKKLDLPHDTMDQIFEDLIKTKFVIYTSNGSTGYLPSKNFENVPADALYKLLDKQVPEGSKPLPLSASLKKIEAEL